MTSKVYQAEIADLVRNHATIPVDLDGYAGVDDYVLTVEPQTAGPTGDKAFRVNDSTGTTHFEVAALGGGGAFNADISTWARHLTVSNVRNWVANNGATFAFNLTGEAVTGPYVSFVSSYQTSGQPSDGFNGTTNIPDDSAGSFVTFAQNTASGAVQNADGGFRASEHELIIYPSTGLTRDCFAAQVGVHTAAPKISSYDVVITGSGSATAVYGDVSVGILSLDQTGLFGWGSTPLPANAGVLVGGNPGHKYAFISLGTSNQVLWAVDGLTGKNHTRAVVPLTTNVYTLGDSTHLYSQVWSNGLFTGNGPTVNPHTNPSLGFRGSGSYSDGLWGVDAGGVVGFSINSTERGRFTSSGLGVTGGITHSGNIQPTTNSTLLLGDSTHYYSQLWASLQISGNGSATNPAKAFIGAGASNDGLFGVVAGGVVGFSVGSAEVGRFNSAGLTVPGATSTATLAVSGATTTAGITASGAVSAASLTASGSTTTAGLANSSFIRRSGIISPAQITSNQNNYNPTGLATASIIQISSDAARNITGIAAQASGTQISLINVGTFAITLKYNDTGNSTAANCFLLPGATDYVLTALSAAEFFYSPSSSRWFKVN